MSTHSDLVAEVAAALERLAKAIREGKNCGIGDQRLTHYEIEQEGA